MLQLTVGTYRLATRKSIIIESERIDYNLRNSSGSGSSSSAACASSGGSGGGCQSPINNREIIFTVRFLGYGDLAAAESLYRSFETYLLTVCNSTRVQYYRRVRDELPLEVAITSAYIKRIDLDLEFDCFGIKSGEVHLIEAEADETTEIAMYNANVLKPVN